MDAETFDFIVVGGGLSGLLIATRLTEDPTIRVLVIEAGQDRSKEPRVTTPGLWPTLLGADTTWNFPKATPQNGLQGREILVPQGRLLGGSSALNGMVFGAPSQANIDAWETLGNTGWGYSAIAKSIERSITVTSHGLTKSNGPVQVTVRDESAGWIQAWKETTSNLGLEAPDPQYGDLAETVDPEIRQRSFVGNTYLDIARARENLTVWTDTKVKQVTLTRHPEIIATGVRYIENGAVQTVQARKEVIISAGAINSPSLLELSGIGDATKVTPLGIDVFVDNPNVGENLQNHPMCYVAHEVLDETGPFDTNDTLVRQDPAALAAAVEAYEHQSGPLAESGTAALSQLPLAETRSDQGRQEIREMLGLIDQHRGASMKPTALAEADESFVHAVLSSGSETTASYLLFPQYVSPAPDGAMVPARAGSEKYISIAAALSYPLSRGSVHVTSAEASPQDLAINPNYLAHAVDLEVMARHVRFIGTLLSTQPLAKQLKPGGLRSPGSPSAREFEDLGAVKSFLRRSAVGAAHYTGTCAMAPREKGGVVDPQLRVYGCKNLRVCDASIIPIIPGTNIQATVYGVAEHAAQIIKSSL